MNIHFKYYIPYFHNNKLGILLKQEIFKKNKLFAIIIFLITYSNLSISQQNIMDQGFVNKEVYSVSIPFNYENERIVLNPIINGKKRKFMLDTGAPTCISSQLLNELKPISYYLTALRDGYNKVDSVNIVLLEKLSFNDLIFTNIPAISQIPEFMECWKLDGIIGSNILKNSVLSILFNEKKIILSNIIDSSYLKNTFETDVEFNFFKNPFITIKINDKISDKILFDTGGAGFYTMSNNVFNASYSQFKAKYYSKGYGSIEYGFNGIAEKSTKYRLKLKNIIFCNTTFNNLYTYPVNSDDSRIGVKIIEYGDITIDYIHSKFYFNSYQNTNNVNSKTRDLYPTYFNGKVIVGEIYGKLLNNFNFGYEILECNGVVLKNNSFCDFMNYEFLFKNDKCVYLIKNAQGIIKKITVKNK